MPYTAEFHAAAAELAPRASALQRAHTLLADGYTALGNGEGHAADVSASRALDALTVEDLTDKDVTDSAQALRVAAAPLL